MLLFQMWALLFELLEYFRFEFSIYTYNYHKILHYPTLYTIYLHNKAYLYLHFTVTRKVSEKDFLKSIKTPLS